MYTTASEPGGVLLLPVREPPRNRLPHLLGGLQARRPAARPRRAWPAAKASPNRSPRTRACSPPSPPPPSAPSTPAGCAARPCCPADPAATPAPAAARTAGTSPARPGTPSNDPRLGRALCGDCYDYTAAVLFNAHAGQLWRRFTTYLPRHLAALGRAHGHSVPRACSPIRYVKVTEYQARGVVHFHAVIRLDPPGDTYQPPGPLWTADLLCQAIQDAADAVVLAVDPGPGRDVLVLAFGPQTDTRPIRPGPALPATGDALPGQAVANYIAKYVTKTLTAPGLPDRRFKARADISRLRCHRHYRQMMTTAWDLGADDMTGDPRLRKWAHALGYGGHCLTKSRALLRHLRPAPPRPPRTPPPPAPPRRRTRPLGPPTRRDHRPDPQDLDLRRNRLHHNPRRRASPGQRRPCPGPPPGQPCRLTHPNRPKEK